MTNCDVLLVRGKNTHCETSQVSSEFHHLQPDNIASIAMADDYAASLWNSLKVVKDTAIKVADTLDEKADIAATHIRKSLSNSTWLPSSARPSPPSPSPSSLAARISPQSPTSSRIINWAWSNRVAVGIVSATSIGIGTYVFTQRQASRRRKRRASRATNGARKEVVVLAGSPHDSVVRSLAIDLERRGFIVFVVVNSMDDEQVVLGIGGRDIRPLHIDLLDARGAEASIARFENYITFPVTAFHGANPHHLQLSGMILVTDSLFPTGPIETITAEHWSDVLNLRLLSPFITARLFISILRTHQSRLLVLTPSITHSLSPPFHAPETVAVAALDAFTTTLRRELCQLNVSVSQLRLGTFDISSISPQQYQYSNSTRADLISWPPSVRSAYGRSYASQEAYNPANNTTKDPTKDPTHKRPVKGSSLRELHHRVFDLITSQSSLPKLSRAGSGSYIYTLIGKIAPDVVINWMMGAKRPLDFIIGGKTQGKIARGNGGLLTSRTASTESMEWEKVSSGS
jgi:NAD(P)-dependent dehydrogenase (short-subunit alcohol dehydrogenase family)